MKRLDGDIEETQSKFTNIINDLKRVSGVYDYHQNLLSRILPFISFLRYLKPKLNEILDTTPIDVFSKPEKNEEVDEFGRSSYLSDLEKWKEVYFKDGGDEGEEGECQPRVANGPTLIIFCLGRVM